MARVSRRSLTVLVTEIKLQDDDLDRVRQLWPRTVKVVSSFAAVRIPPPMQPRVELS